MPPENNILLKLTDEFVDIMCDVNDEYRQYVRYEGKIKVLYVKVLHAIYSCLESSMLWYDLYSSTFQQMGFVLNPYDHCVANKEINGSTCTIVFYVDDNKISHKDPEVVRSVVETLKEYYGEFSAPMILTSSIVPFKKPKIHFSFNQSSSVLLETRLQRKATTTSISGLPRLEIYSNFATTE